MYFLLFLDIYLKFSFILLSTESILTWRASTEATSLSSFWLMAAICEMTCDVVVVVVSVFVVVEVSVVVVVDAVVSVDVVVVEVIVVVVVVVVVSTSADSLWRRCKHRQRPRWRHFSSRAFS